MDDPTDRTDRFELVAATAGDTLAGLANAVLETDPPFTVLQEPKPQLLMQRVREPVERRPFNLGEVVVTAAEVEIGDSRGFAMYPGKAERAALSGAVVDAAVADGHEHSDRITAELAATAEERAAERANEWGETRHTAVEFETMEDDL